MRTKQYKQRGLLALLVVMCLSTTPVLAEPANAETETEETIELTDEERDFINQIKSNPMAIQEAVNSAKNQRIGISVAESETEEAGFFNPGGFLLQMLKDSWAILLIIGGLYVAKYVNKKYILKKEDTEEEKEGKENVSNEERDAN